ncbi:MAG: PEP/pyruvate-binding domain-containing protein [Candidatus Woesearchaeota archaeon]
MKYLKMLSELNISDVSFAGGKGASLGEMIQVGIPVPPGFVILSNTFEEFLFDNQLNQRINELLKNVNPNDFSSVNQTSAIIQEVILNSKICPERITEINVCFKGINTEFVAVRSSATAEDGISNAWAGQLDSFLNVTATDLIDKVKRCWASLFTPRAIFYCIENQLVNKEISVAVVVQKMIQSEVSGIAFSVHPVTKDPKHLIIEAGYGLGEAIVSGQITPDDYTVDKNNLEILDKNIGYQERMIIRTKNGNEWVKVDDNLSKIQKLTEREILELSRLILVIENHYNFPVDVEWAKEKEVFYVVQSRPITTI